MKTISHSDNVAIKKTKQFTCLAEQYLDSDVLLSSDESNNTHRKKRKIKRKKDNGENDEIMNSEKLEDYDIKAKNNNSESHNKKFIEQEHNTDFKYMTNDGYVKIKKNKIKNKEKVDGCSESLNISSENVDIEEDSNKNLKKVKKYNKLKTEIASAETATSNNILINTSDTVKVTSDDCNATKKKKKKKLKIHANEESTSTEIDNTNEEFHNVNVLNHSNKKSKKNKNKTHKEITVTNKLGDNILNGSDDRTDKSTCYSKNDDTENETKFRENNHKYINDNDCLNEIKIKSKKRKRTETCSPESVLMNLEYANGDNGTLEHSTRTLNNDKYEEFIDEGIDMNHSHRKKHKKKHKKNFDNFDQTDDVIDEKIGTENAECTKLKKKKKKKHSKELNFEEAYDKKLLEIKKEEIEETEENNQNTVVNVEQSYKQKKHKKKNKKSANNFDLLDSVIEEKIDSENIKCTRIKKKKKKNHSGTLNFEESYDEISLKIKKEENEETEEYRTDESVHNERNIKTNKNETVSDSQNSSESSDEHSESERIPRLRKPKSVLDKYPKVARIMEESDDDDYYPHFQYRKMTLSEALKLANLKIQLRHEVLPQHNVEKLAGTRSLTKEEKKEFEKYITMRTGKFYPEEDQRIVHNWKKFCKKHDWKRSIIYPFLHEKRKGFFFLSTLDERRKFIQFLANGLPERSLYSVYHRFKILYAVHKTNRYTKEEDELIMNEIKKLPDKNKFSILARKLNRTRMSVWRHYRLLKQKDESNSDSKLKDAHATI